MFDLFTGEKAVTSPKLFVTPLESAATLDSISMGLSPEELIVVDYDGPAAALPKALPTDD